MPKNDTEKRYTTDEVIELAEGAGVSKAAMARLLELLNVPAE